MAKQTPAKQLFDLLVTRDFDPELRNSAGKPETDPAQAEVFSFDFIGSSGKNYGSVVIMLNEDNALETFFGDNVGRSMEGHDKNDWYAFLEQLKHFSVKNLYSFGLKNINKLKYSMQGQAAIKEGLFESWNGNKHTSWNDKPEHVRLMIKHKKPIGEGDARYRYVESLFVETSDGERFKLPFTKLAGGRAMCEHIRNGGKPYDPRGQHICEIVEELNVLSRFRRANHGKVFEGDTAALITETNVYYETLNRVLKGLNTKRGYTNYFENWDPAEITEQDVVVESIKSMFVKHDLDRRIEEALPILARIQQQGHAMKEANIFESWINNLSEGTWATPDTPEKKEKLAQLLSQELPVGADATNATEQLYDLLGDDELFDQLESLANVNANADARQTVFLRMQELSDDSDIAEVLGSLTVDVDSPTEPSDDFNQDIQADETGVEQDVEEGTFRDEDGSPDEDDLDEQGIPGSLPPSQVPGKEKLLKTPVTSSEKILSKIKDFVKGASGNKDVETFGSLKEQDLEEADVLNTFEADQECNHTAEGVECPVHGVKECYSLMAAPVAESDEFLTRIRTLSGIMVK